MKVTVDEAAKILKCSKANIYQQIKKHNIKTEMVMKEIRYIGARKTRKLVFELDDLTNK